MRKRTRFLIFFQILILILGVFWAADPVQAQTETGYDLVEIVNTLRRAQGLEPYVVDPWIMEYAQQHTQYQADNHISTHTHSDGSVSLSIGLVENVAGGDEGYVTCSVVVYQIWVDWGHLRTMIGYASGEVGAGVALSDDGTVYYTLNVRPGPEIEVQETVMPGTEIGGNLTAETPAPAATAVFVPLITNTPNTNGSIIHVVGSGETLWGIAISYGVTMEQIRVLNGLPEDQTLIYSGQRLTVRIVPSDTPTAEPQITPTLTLTKTKVPPETPTASLSTTISPIHQSAESDSQIDFPWTILGLGVIFGAGLMSLVYSRLTKLKRK